MQPIITLINRYPFGGINHKKGKGFWLGIFSIVSKKLGGGPSSIIYNSKGYPISISTKYLKYPISDQEISIISKYLLSLEDKRFYKHSGVEIRSIARALLANLKSLRVVQGGSTLTQQLVRNLFLGHEKTIRRKIKEIILAILAEVILSKEQILRLYCENVYMGNGILGIQAASMAIYRRRVFRLNGDEIISIIGLLRLPNKHNPYRNKEAFVTRQKSVARIIDSEERFSNGINIQALNPIRIKIKPKLQSLVRSEIEKNYSSINSTEISKIFTTIDSALQSSIDKSLKNISQKRNIKSVAFIAINKEGEIVTESSWQKGKETEFSVPIMGKVQPGSTLKPLLLLSALNQGLSLDDHFKSAPFMKDLGYGKTWSVRNYQEKYHGQIKLINALAMSDNSVFARLAEGWGRATLTN